MLRLAVEDAKTEGPNADTGGLMAAPKHKHMEL
jgi:hypothetical protein